ncbi:MAG: RNA polymerase sigma factor [Planctomycetota bacterium]
MDDASQSNLDECLAGRKDAWDGFVEAHAGLIYAAVRRTVGRRAGGPDPVEPDDIVQEVFLRLVKDDFRLLRTFDRQRASLSTWLTVVTRSVAIDQLRRRRLETISLDHAEGHSVSHAAPDPPAEGGEAGLLPLHLLTARQRLVLRLLFDQEQTVAEAAAFLSVDEQTIRSTKHKALSRLRDHVAAEKGARSRRNAASEPESRG